MNNVLKSVAVAALAFAPFTADAATFNFQDMANSYKSANGGMEADFDLYAAHDATLGDPLLTDGGISVIDVYGNGTNHALFDGDGSGNAGAGVCKSGYKLSGQSECSSNGGSQPGDDNMTGSEILYVEFDTTVNLDNIWISGTLDTGNGHGVLSGSMAILINGNPYDVVNGQLSAADIASIDAGDVFSIQAGAGYEVYLKAATVSAVPLPAGIFLLGAGLGGLGLMRRKRTV